MTFENIDTPVSDDVLLGEEAKSPLPAAEENKGAEGTTSVEEGVEAEKDEKPEQKAEREPVIPRARFDELNAKLHQERQEKERLLAELEATRKPAQTPAQDTNIAALENEFYEAMMAGEQEKAVAIRSKINEAIFARAEAVSAEKVARGMSEREATTEVEKVAAEVVAAHPFLDSNSPDANKEAIAEVVEWRDFYAAKGDSLAVALAKAVNKIAPLYAPEKQPEPKTDTRKQAAIARNLADSAAQAPAPVAGIGNRTTPPAPRIETQKDWESLSTAEREAILAGT